jgi:hypothetical protein
MCERLITSARLLAPQQDLEKSNGVKLENKDIFAYLIMPVQRIPRYQLLLRDLLKHTEKDHNDYESLQKV